MSMQKLHHRVSSGGYSIVELLVVVSIISILAVAGYVSFDGYIRQANDAERMQDLTAIAKLMQLSINQDGPIDCDRGIKIEPGFPELYSGGCADRPRIMALFDEFYNEIPHDPVGPGDERFFYYFDPQHNCASTPQQSLMFGNLEVPENSNREEVCGEVGTDGNNDGYYTRNTSINRDTHVYVVSLGLDQ